MSQTALGEALGYKTSMISAFETGNVRPCEERIACGQRPR